MKIGIYTPGILEKAGGAEGYAAHLVDVIQKTYCSDTITIITTFCDKKNSNASSKDIVEKLNNTYGCSISENNFFVKKITSTYPKQNIFRKVISFFNIYIASRSFDVFWSGICASHVIPVPDKRNKLSYTIVHFPPIPITYKKRNLLSMFVYNFVGKKWSNGYDYYLCNSAYTAGWLKKMWNIDNSKVKIVYPPVNIIPPHQEKKENIIIAVSRISPEKKIEYLFEGWKQIYLKYSDYKFVIVGSYNENDKISLEYYEKLMDISEHCSNVQIMCNIDYETLKKLYQKSKFFWHAMGFGIDENEHAVKLEHFGMTTVEAMSAGCIPIVINAGGQKEIVEQGLSGYKWNDLNELVYYTEKLLQSDNDVINEMSFNSINRAKLFSKDVFFNNIKEIMSKERSAC
jgi:glycosyltransferase involved in cell wall biosynthesis